MTAPRQRSGAHRPRRRVGRVLAPLLVVAVVVAAVLAGVRWLPSINFAGSTSGGSTAGGSSPAGTSTSSSSSGSAAPATTSPQPSGSPTSSPSDGTEAVDRSVPVTVLNGTGRAGLATRAAATLRSAGWAVGSLGNYRNGAPSSTVYYPESRLRATARAVSDDLPGSQRVVRSSRFGATVTVVLGPDYAG